MLAWLRRFWQRSPLADVPAPSADHQVFEAAVASAFSYLTDHYGYTRRPLRVIAYERFVEFNKPAATVIVQQEIGGAPWVTLVALKSVVPGLRSEFGLHELEQEMEKLGRYAPTPVSPANIQESVNVLASTLEQIGSEVLNGNFSVLFTRQQRHVDAVGKNS